ncbi:MAG: tetratricopeptide repeat protein [Rhodospirillaceae bacterium]
MTSNSLSSGRTITIAVVLLAVAAAAGYTLTSAPFTIEKVKAAAGGVTRAANAPPPKPAGLASAFLAGRHAQATSDGAAAITFYDQVLNFDPENIGILTNSYFLAAQVGNFDAAFPTAKKAYDLEPRAGMAPVLLAVQAFKAKDYDKAWSYLAKTPAQSMNGFAMPLLKAWALAPTQPQEKAEAELNQLKSFQDTADVVEATAGLLNEFYGNTEGALAHYDTLAKRIEEQRISIIRVVAEGYQRLGKPEKAKDALTRYQTVRGRSPAIEAYLQGTAAPRKITPQIGMAEALYAAAEMLLLNDANDYRAQVATAYAQTALYLEPDFSMAQRFVGTALSARGHIEESNAVLATVKKSAPDYLESQVLIAENYARSKKVDEAVAILRNVAKDKGGWPDVYVAIGDMLRVDKKYAEAVSAYDSAIKAAPEGKAGNWALYYSRGIALERSKQWDLAEKDFRKALEIKPDEPNVLNYLGYSYLDRGEKLPEARKLIEAAYAKRPDAPEIMDSLGWVLYVTGEYDKAVEYLEKAVEGAAGDGTVNEHLGDAYWRVGRKAEARFQWQRALSLDIEDSQRTGLQNKLAHGLAQK